ncbi:LytR family transcriptional attenuator [Blastococcus colisei]|uniref:LytR family transcriptional attenuator n=1 Tax=Blastococcus colisei TaxID=1564162 RepID=A0A543PBQ8_9ACTN|nr:LCP family protein [Blastococcus colisei]TQN41484.1 LytR family transcriptional attenuator [Blastococcus colisei]
MSRVQEVRALPARPLPPRLDPRVGRPPRARRDNGSAASSNAAAPPVHPRWADDRPRTAPHGFGRVLGLTTLGAVVPGSALVAAGARRSGWTLVALFAALGTGLALLATVGRDRVVGLAVDPTAMLGVIVAAVGLAVVWTLVIIAGYRMLAPESTTRAQHLAGTVLVSALSLGIAAPAFEVAHLAAVQRDLIQNLFADGESATVDPVDATPFGDKERVNVLLLGGDGGEGRDGVRTDTIMVASIATDTGATTLFSLPRNLQELPFPEDSPLHDVYPDGFWSGSEGESLLNAVYRNGPSDHPDVLGATDDPGADFLKLGVGEALGLTLDYYVLVNLEGFSRLIDALGGITVNVNYFVPIGGEPTIGILPEDYIAPGADQRMDGERALHYARGRFGLTDYERMDRQRCMVDAIVSAADPMTMLTQYQEIAATTQDIVSTDIPQAVVGDFADLALKVKDTEIRSVVFDDSVIRPAYPDYDAMRALVREALAAPVESAPAVEATTAPPAAASAPSASAPAPAAGAGQDAATAPTPVAGTTDACAYDPVRAAESIAEGEPPTRRR